LRSARAGRSPLLLLPDVEVSLEPPLAPIVLPPAPLLDEPVLLPELPVPEAPIDVPELPVPLVDGELLAVLPVVPLVDPAPEPVVEPLALGLVLELLPEPLGLVMPPLDEPEPPAPEAPLAPEPAPAPEPEPEPAPPAPPAPPEPWAIDRPPMARAAAAAKAVRVFLVVIMT
jgi:hypothetical protein